VLTDRDYFEGSLADLAAAKAATSLPVLRKDFTLDPLQVVEARASGADAVLLIVRILSDASLVSLLAEAKGLGMAVLVEVHDRGELARALDVGAEIVGINNRDLATFGSDLGTTLELLEDVPDEVIVVSESGIRGPEDAALLGDAGVDAILVGETLLRAPDPQVGARHLATIPRAASRRERVRG
jgi:indole-3-glycerol phosphate synthase